MIYGFIGLGLIGGSIAKAIRAYIPSCTIIAYDIDPESIALALADGVINQAAPAIDDSFSSCSFLFLCATVQENDKNLLTLKKFAADNCIITDVGSVKSDIHTHIAQAGLTHQFIGGHPMTGSERTGYRNAKASLLENAYYILTPTDETREETIIEYQNLIRTLKAIPLVMSAQEHDYVTAAVSHLPHVIAAALVNLVKNSDTEDGIMKIIAAGGFKDITRIASSSPALWEQVCLANAGNISALLERYIIQLQEIRTALNTNNQNDYSNHSDPHSSLYHFFEAAGHYRDSMPGTTGAITRMYSLYVDIPDKTGALATIATMLAGHNISIKNIGIVHNREYESGVLRIEFPTSGELENAAILLAGKEYHIYRN